MKRWFAIVIVLGACGGSPAPHHAPGSGSGSGSGSILGADGTHVAVERTYVGHCAPPGSRGGCLTITLRPDGTYRHVFYDAAIEGTYTISGNTVTLSGPSSGEGETMTLSADGTRLGEMMLRPPPKVE
jgi:hypothetical protein